MSNPNHTRTSLIMRTPLVEKLDRVAESTKTTKNAILTALVTHLSEAELGHIVTICVEAGDVKTSAKAEPGKKALLEQLKLMPAADLAKLLANQAPAEA